MSFRNLVYWNHDEETVQSHFVIEEACRRLKIILEPFKDAKAGWLGKSRLAVFHGRPPVVENDRIIEIDYYNYLSRTDVPSFDGFVAVFMSSALLTHLPIRRIPFTSSDGATGTRFLMPIPQTLNSGLIPSRVGNASPDQAIKNWEELFEALLDRQNLDDWVKKPCVDGAPAILNKIFCNRTGKHLLVALAILCSGYLAVHATSDRSDEGDWLPEDLTTALDQMGWSRISIVLDSEFSQIKQKLQQEKERVRDRNWWLQPLGLLNGDEEVLPEQWVIFKQNLKKECYESGHSDLYPELRSLLELISRKGGAVAPPRIVADAYLSLARKLSEI